MEERNKAENELIHLREQLKQKVLSEELYKQNLRGALEKNAQRKVHSINNEHFPSPLSDPFMTQHNELRKPVKIMHNDYQLRGNTGDNGGIGQVKTRQEGFKRLQESDFGGAFAETLAHDTKMIPLTVFDKGHGMSVNNPDQLTLSKIQEYAIRPSSVNQWENKNDALDLLMKNQRQMRPSSSEKSRDFLDTSHLIGKKLDEADAILQMYAAGYNNFDNSRKKNDNPNRTNILSSAGKNIMQMSSGSENNLGYKPYDYKPYDYKNDMASDMGGSVRESEGILLEKGYALHNDHSSLGFMDQRDRSIGLNSSQGSTFNLDKINLANEERLRYLEKQGSGGLDTLKSNKGNYYGVMNNRFLETIKEDDDDEIAKLDKLLLTYGNK
jgi:hypothetical protein